MFSGHDESGGDVVEKDGVKFKVQPRLFFSRLYGPIRPFIFPTNLEGVLRNVLRYCYEEAQRQGEHRAVVLKMGFLWDPFHSTIFVDAFFCGLLFLPPAAVGLVQVAEYRSSEGKHVLMPYRGPVSHTVLDILGGIRSACTYTPLPWLHFSVLSFPCHNQPI